MKIPRMLLNVLIIGELHLGLVLSTKAHARLLNVDPTDALSMPGVVDFVSHKDVPGSNSYGFFTEGEELIFAVDTVMLSSFLLIILLYVCPIESAVRL